MQIINQIDLCLAGRKFRQRVLEKITGLVIHRNEVGPGALEQARAFRDNPVYSEVTGGMPPYHYVIRVDGVIEQALPLTTIGAHVKGANTPTIGICCVGDFRKSPPTPKQWESAKLLVKDLCQKLKIKTILGHDEYPEVTKFCPGKYFDMNKFRAEVSIKP